MPSAAAVCYITSGDADCVSFIFGDVAASFASSGSGASCFFFSGSAADGKTREKLVLEV